MASGIKKSAYRWGGPRAWGTIIVIIAGTLTFAGAMRGESEVLRGNATVVDGDTLDVSGQRVRIQGLDAPELDQVCWTGPAGDEREWPCGDVSRQRLVELVADVELRCEGRVRDQYDRLLATCFADGLDIGEPLVEEGLALSRDVYLGQQNAAQAARRGVWEGRFDMPSTWREARDREGESQDVWSRVLKFIGA